MSEYQREEREIVGKRKVDVCDIASEMKKIGEGGNDIESLLSNHVLRAKKVKRQKIKDASQRIKLAKDNLRVLGMSSVC